MPNTGNKHNVSIYISKELFDVIERERGLILRSTFIEHTLKNALIKDTENKT